MFSGETFTGSYSIGTCACVHLRPCLIKNEHEEKFERNMLWNPAENDDNHKALLDQPVSDVTVGEIHIEIIYECLACSEFHVRTAMCATNTATGDTAEKKARGRDKE